MDSDLSTGQYQDLAEFRRQIRQFIYFREITAREHGLEPQHHQLMLLVHGLPGSAKPTIREIAARLCIQHHSTVELVDRLETAGMVARSQGGDDRREVWVRLTTTGRRLLRS